VRSLELQTAFGNENQASSRQVFPSLEASLVCTPGLRLSSLSLWKPPSLVCPLRGERLQPGSEEFD